MNFAPQLKVAYCDVDLHGRSDREEWAHLRYSERFDPAAGAAFEMRLQWTVGTGALIADLASHLIFREDAALSHFPEDAPERFLYL